MSLTQIQKQYYEYAFINDPSEAVDDTVGKVGASLICPTLSLAPLGAPPCSPPGSPPGDLKKPQASALSLCLPLLAPSYEKPHVWYFLVFKPYDRAYNKDPAWFQVKGLDRCRKILKRQAVHILTRETDATKTHINMVCCTDQDILVFHEKDLANKYKIHAQVLKDYADRENATTYMFKEELKRPFINYLDYIKYSR